MKLIVLLHTSTNRNIERSFFNAYNIFSKSLLFHGRSLHSSGIACLEMMFLEKHPIGMARREEPLKQSPPGSVFCLRNNFFVGRLAVFSVGGRVWSRWIHFSRARCLGASLLSAAEPGVAAGTKTAADGYERKALVGIGEQERDITPAKTNPTVEITLGIRCTAEVISNLV